MAGIGEAVEALQRGLAVRRAAWGSNGVWLALVDPGTEGGRELRIGAFRESLDVETPPFVMVKTARAVLEPWTCNQADLLASDWEVVPEAERS